MLEPAPGPDRRSQDILDAQFCQPTSLIPEEPIFIAVSPASASADSRSVPRGPKPSGPAFDAAQFHVHEPDCPIATFGFRQSHDFPPHRLAHKDQLALPFDLPRVPHSHEALGPRPPTRVYVASPRPYPARLEDPWYDATHQVRRPFRVEFAPQPVKPALLLRRRCRRWSGRLFLQRQVESLMAPILLRMAGINPIELDAQFQPPHRQM
jgi:hypothetical protein